MTTGDLKARVCRVCGASFRVRQIRPDRGKYCSRTCADRNREPVNNPRTHGQNTRNSHTYRIWAGMIQRCCNPKRDHYFRYGGRGISVTPRWRTFENFLHDMGECPAGLTLERVDNAKGYERANCRWATRKQQARNTRRNRLVSHDGQTMSVVEWSEATGLRANLIVWRLDNSWPAEKALTTPAGAGFIAGKSRRDLQVNGSPKLPSYIKIL